MEILHTNKGVMSKHSAVVKAALLGDDRRQGRSHLFLLRAGADPGFSWGGGGHRWLCVCTRIKSAKPEVPYGQSQGPLKSHGRGVRLRPYVAD